MNSRIPLVALFDKNSLDKINLYINKIEEQLCKVPFGRNVNRMDVDTLPYHFTLSSWDIKEENYVVKELTKIKFNKFNVLVDDVEIMNGKENSFVLCFHIKPNNMLRKLQKSIYNILPNENFNPEKIKFHITIHIDKDYEKIIRIRETLLKDFIPFELEVNTLGLFEIYPAKMVKIFESRKD